MCMKIKFLNLFIEYLQIEKNCSHYTIESYQKDIEEFVLFMTEQGYESIDYVEYFDARYF